MTKKFWSDWQNRIGETSNVYVYRGYHNKYASRLLNNWEYMDGPKDKIIKAEFHNDTVDLVIERHHSVWTNGRNQFTSENEYVTIHRIDIKYIEFIKKVH